MTRRLLSLVGLLLLAPLARAGGAPVTTTHSPVIWRQGEPFSLDVLARRAAPVFWLSPGEPVFDGLSDLPIEAGTVKPCPRPPSRGPTTETSQPRSVFYRVDSVRLLEDLPQPPNDVIDVDHERTLPERRASMSDATWAVDDFRFIVFRYMVYFPCDQGFRGHVHDLENVLVRIRIRQHLIGIDPDVTAQTRAGRCHETGGVLQRVHAVNERPTNEVLPPDVERDVRPTEGRTCGTSLVVKCHRR